jgi:DNA (cytosine-5)-methyltransferase 1
MKIGSLFSGAGGLDLAVEEVFGGEVIWQCEMDKAASKVLAYRYPCAPNLGDITAVDWSTVETPDILCGGFPCQDVSAAGKRAGIKDGTRSGLWSVFADIIDTLRPPIVIIENVRGLLSAKAHRNLESDRATLGDGTDGPVLRAAGAVLGDLADIGYDAQWTTLAAGDVGAPHRRERVFILARDTSSTSGWANSSAAAEWGVQRELSGTASDDAADSGGNGFGRGAERNLELLPTACAQQSGNTPENHLAKKPGRKVVTDLAILVENGLLESGGALLPTPVVTDSSDSARRTIIGGTSHPGTSLTDAIRLLPTPNASDCTGGGQHPDKRTGHSRQLIDYALLCTPAASDGAGGKTSRSGGRIDEPLLGGQAREMATAWGKYEPAIRRWESLTRPAPAPTEPNKNGNPRLSAAFSEWLMGWPDGWVTDPDIGISRNDQLRIVGNGVCPQQATAALTYLLTIQGE